MIAWNRAYDRIAANPADFIQYFGRMYARDEFRPYSYAVKFDALRPAMSALAANFPNNASYAQTAGSATPGTAVVPGPAETRLIDFPAGAVILGITSAASIPQRKFQVETNPPTSFAYGPPAPGGGGRELYLLDLSFADGDPITTGNPISEIVSNPNSPTITRPPINADALMGDGESDDVIGRELYVTPGLGINVEIRSLLLPAFLAVNFGASKQVTTPVMGVHLVFHAMVPGTVKAKPSE